jgi:glutamate-ammonia-ligase adenylyltransferase
MLDRPVDLAGHLQRLEGLKTGAGPLDLLRAYRQTQLLRIFLRDILGLTTLPGIFAEHSALAEACLVFVDRLQSGEGDLTVIAVGKFGGQEIGYGTDLDVLFVGEDVRAAQHLMVTMAQPTGEGSIWTLDARLRPDGEKGILSCSLPAFEAYYQTRAQLWEAQALTRARPIAGPLQAGFMALAQRVWGVAGQRPDLFGQIHAMLQRIQRDRSSSSDELDFKTGKGGIIEAEFLVQALQMRAGLWNPQMTRALGQLVEGGIMERGDTEELRKHYEYLRSIESILRRWENKSVSILPADKIGQERLAARAGAESLDAFAQSYREARQSIHAISSRYLR